MIITEMQQKVVHSDSTVRFRRTTAAIVLPLAFVFQLVCNAIYAWVSTSSGMSDTHSSAEMLEMYAAYPTAITVCSVLALIGCLLTIPGLPAALRVMRPAKPRLTLWAVIMMVAGYSSYFGVAFVSLDHVGLAVAHVDAATALDASPAQTWAMPFFLLFVIGNLGGTLLLGLAVILGGKRVAVPWWAGALISCWSVGHIINIAGGGEWFAVGGGALQIVGFAIVTAAALRLSDTEWVERG